MCNSYVVGAECREFGENIGVVPITSNETTNSREEGKVGRTRRRRMFLMKIGSFNIRGLGSCVKEEIFIFFTKKSARYVLYLGNEDGGVHGKGRQTCVEINRSGLV